MPEEKQLKSKMGARRYRIAFPYRPYAAATSYHYVCHNVADKFFFRTLGTCKLYPKTMIFFLGGGEVTQCSILSLTVSALIIDNGVKFTIFIHQSKSQLSTAKVNQ